jgi:hypothetical protein
MRRRHLRSPPPDRHASPTHSRPYTFVFALRARCYLSWLKATYAESFFSLRDTKVFFTAICHCRIALKQL